MVNKAGWIYILISSSDYSRSKIGRAVNPYKRYMDLRTADPNLGFVAGYYMPERYTKIYSMSTIESAIHAELKDYRMENFEEGKTEWFKITYENAMLEVEERICAMFDVDLTSHCCFFDENNIIKMYEEDIRHYFRPDKSDQNFLNTTKINQSLGY